MKYADGRDARVGDRVKLWNKQLGTVVCSIDTGEFTQECPKKEWDYLKSGVIVKTDMGELFHYVEADEDLRLIRSTTTP